jgi:transposase
VDDAIAEAVEVSQPTVSRVRKQYVEQGLEAALNRRPPTREYVRKLDGVQEAKLIALACAKPPTGQARWSLRLLADKLVELEIVEDAVSYQTVRRMLKKTRSSRT